MGKILDLDKVVIDDKILRLDGKEFKIPGGFTVKEALQVQKIASEVQEDPVKLEKAIDIIWEIIARVNPDKKKDEFVPKIQTNMLSDLIGFMFLDQNKQDDEDEVFDNSGERSGR